MGVHVALEGFGTGSLGPGPPDPAADRHPQARPGADHPDRPRPAEPGAVRVDRRASAVPGPGRRRRGRGDARPAGRARAASAAASPRASCIARPMPLAELRRPARRQRRACCWPGHGRVAVTAARPRGAAAAGRRAARRRGCWRCSPSRWRRRSWLRRVDARTRPGRAARWPRSSSASLVLRRSRGLDPLAGTAWRGFAGIAGPARPRAAAPRRHRRRASTPLRPGSPTSPLAATGPVAVLLCVRLVRSTGGPAPRPGRRWTPSSRWSPWACCWRCWSRDASGRRRRPTRC